jgi:predicted restriction endonuclease
MKRSDDYLYEIWRADVVKRYKNKCAICKKKKGVKHAHHLDAWNSSPLSRYDVYNGICLCSKCHNDFHDKYGKGNNTYYQFEEY